MNGLKKIRVKVMGVTPLMMHRMGDEELLSLRTKIKPPKSRSTEITPREEAEKRLYVDKSGQPYIPSNWLMACLIAAGQYCRLDGKRQMSTKKTTMVPGFLTLLGTHFPLTNMEWEVDIAQGRNENSGDGICIVRPRFDEWGFTFEMTIDANQVSENQIRELVDIGLSRMGLGSRRPQRKGTYGRSVVSEWKVL